MGFMESKKHLTNLPMFVLIFILHERATVTFLGFSEFSRNQVDTVTYN